MNPAHPDREVADRMQAAAEWACIMLGVQPEPAIRPVHWGWRGRTLSQPVTASGAPAWLRLASVLKGQIVPTFWEGAVQAQKAIPAAVPRPRLRDSRNWSHETWEYRAELYDRLAGRSISQTAALTTAADLPPRWWAALRSALADVAAVPTDRRTIEQQYLDWAMPKFLGRPLDTETRSWVTAHGDLHWANLYAPGLQIIDWEGWGLAPAGYDAATLHTYSLLVPAAAARVRAELADPLYTPQGRFAELVAITELLHSVAGGDNTGLAEPLRQQAARLLNRLPP